MGAADPLASSMGWELFGASLPPWRPNIDGYAHILQDMFGAKWKELRALFFWLPSVNVEVAERKAKLTKDTNGSYNESHVQVPAQ